MQPSSKKVVIEILNKLKPSTILDAPCGGGWLHEMLPYKAELDGIDLYDTPVAGYRQVVCGNLDAGIADNLPQYEAIACCEGLEHFGNPLLFLVAKRPEADAAPPGVRPAADEWLEFAGHRGNDGDASHLLSDAACCWMILKSRDRWHMDSSLQKQPMLTGVRSAIFAMSSTV